MTLLPRLALAWFAVWFALTASCSRRETNVEAGRLTQTLHIGNGTEPRDLDPHIITGNSDCNIMWAVMEGLTSNDPIDSHAIPGVAESWQVSGDGLTWTFHLRRGASWSNGDPVHASDFAYGFERVLSPALGAEYAALLFCLKNAEQFNAGKLKDFSKVGVLAVDDHTLVLTLKSPTRYLPDLVAMPCWFPVHRATIEKFGRIDARGTAWTQPANFVGNGPFVLTEWKPNQSIRVARSKTYWDRAHVRLAAAVYYPMEAAPEEIAFRTGQLHLTTEYVTTAKAVAYRSDPKRAPLLRENTMFSTWYITLNVTQPPLNDVRVRRALSLAIDRKQLAQNVLQSDLAAVSLTPPGLPGYAPRTSLRTNIDEARLLLATAGYPGGRGFPPLEALYSNSVGANQPLMEALQEIWRKNLGIEIRLILKESKIADDDLQHKRFQLGKYSWLGDYPDPTTFLDALQSANGYNHSGWSSAAYDHLLENASQTLDPGRRFELLGQAEALLLEELPIIPLFYWPQRTLVHPTVKGWYDNVLVRHPLKFIYLQDSGASEIPKSARP